MRNRALFDLVFVFSAITTPIFATFSLMLLGFFFFPRYFEAVVVAFLIEFLYRGKGSDILGGHLPLTALALFAFILVEVLRSLIREQRT